MRQDMTVRREPGGAHGHRLASLMTRGESVTFGAASARPGSERDNGTKTASKRTLRIRV